MNIKASKEVNKTNQGIRYIKAYGFLKFYKMDFGAWLLLKYKEE